MEPLKYLIIILACTSLSIGVRINMQGSVSLGKEVLETLSHYMQKNSAALNSRRAGLMAPLVDENSDQVKWTVISANVGRGLEMCNGALGDFIRDYVLMLSSAIESIFDGILSQNKLNNDKTGSVFIDQLRRVLVEIQDLLRLSNKNNAVEKEEVEWVAVIKGISHKFQKAAIAFVDERLDGDPKDIMNVKKKFVQKLIIAIILVENKFQTKLCNEHRVCIKEHECTMALKTVLEEFTNVANDKAKEFIKAFYESLPENLFYFLNSETDHEFQVVLSDLSYTMNPPTKDVLLSVLKTVDARLKLLKNNVTLSKAYDQQLVHVILDDMDYVYYTKKKSYPFDSFIGEFTRWMKQGDQSAKFGPTMRAIMKKIKEKLSVYPPNLTEKLLNQIRIFLELTVDPMKPQY